MQAAKISIRVGLAKTANDHTFPCYRKQNEEVMQRIRKPCRQKKYLIPHSVREEPLRYRAL
jgi:hypothetical protein